MLGIAIWVVGTANAQEPSGVSPIQPISTVTPLDSVTKAAGDLASNQTKQSLPQLTYRIPKEQERYLLGPGDTVLITVFRYPELSRAVRIEGDGTIRLPLIRSDIQAACLTVEQLAGEVAKRYLDYLKDPQVDVSIRDYSSEPVAVVGAVNKPGSFALQRRVRLREMLAFAGGPSPMAGRLVQIMHDEPGGSACQTPASAGGKETSQSEAPALSMTATSTNADPSTSGNGPSGDPTNSGSNSVTFQKETMSATAVLENSGTQIRDKGSLQTSAAKPPEPSTLPAGASGTTESTTAPGITYVDLVELMQGGGTDPFIRPGDIINIPEASSAFVIGDVNRPTVVPLNKQIMLSRAIALAGGTTPNARNSRVRIVRYIDGKGGNTQIIVNLKDIYTNKKEDVALRAGDIVQVPGSTAKSMMKSILWLGSWWSVYNAYNIIH